LLLIAGCRRNSYRSVSAEDGRAQQQTRRLPLLLLLIDGTDELMDGRMD